MKVLVVSEPGVDGVFRYVETLCHFLHAQGVEVHLAYSDRRGSERLQQLVAWVEQQGGRTVNLRTANRPAWSDVTAFWALRRLVREVRPDVIHSHSSKAGFLARSLALIGCRAPQFYHPHAYVGMRPAGARLDFLYNLIEAGLGRVSQTITVSRAEKAFAQHHLKIPAPRVHLLHNGVDTDLFAPLPPSEKSRRRAELGLPRDQPILGFIGRSSAQKDPVTLYRAFAQVAAERPVTLLHVGKGDLDAELEQLVAELGIGSRVVRLPYTSTPHDFYQVLDGFILTSRYEGLSLAALEALASNLPMILSDAPGNEDFLCLPLSHGWKAAPGDVAGFARGIAAWLDRLKSGAPVNHRRLARQRFNLQRQYGAVLHLYRQALAPDPGVRTGFPQRL